MISTVLNEKTSWFFRCFRIKIILGWNLYLSIALSIGLEISFDDLLVMNLFSLIFNVDTAFLKSLLSSFAIRLPSCHTWSFSTSLICDLQFPLFEKNGLIVFQNNWWSVTKDVLGWQAGGQGVRKFYIRYYCLLEEVDTGFQLWM